MQKLTCHFCYFKNLYWKGSKVNKLSDLAEKYKILHIYDAKNVALNYYVKWMAIFLFVIINQFT